MLLDLESSHLALLKEGQYSQLLNELENNVQTPHNRWLVAKVLTDLGEYEKAATLLEELKSGITNTSEIALTYYFIAELLLSQGKIERGVKAIQKGLDQFNKPDPPPPTLQAYFKVLEVACPTQVMSKGSTETLERLLESTSHDEFLRAKTYYSMGIGYYNSGLMNKALEYQNHSLELFERLDYRVEVSKIYGSISHIYFQMGFLQQALDYRMQSIRFEEANGLKPLVNISLVKLGMIYNAMGKPNQAMDSLTKAIAMAEALDNQKIKVMTLMYMAAAIDKHNRGYQEILDQFPSNVESPLINLAKTAVKAFIAKQKENYGEAEELIQLCLESEDLTFDLRLYGYQALADIAFKRWVVTKSDERRQTLQQRLEEWENVCEFNHLTPQLCQIALLRGKLALASFDFTEAKSFYESCLQMAEEYELELFHKTAKGELQALNSQVQQLSALAGLARSGFEQNQLQEFGDYLNDINKLLQGQQE